MYNFVNRSDPVIQSYSLEQRIRQRKKKDITPEVLALVRPLDASTFHTYDLCFEPDEEVGLAPSFVVNRPSFGRPDNGGDRDLHWEAFP